jgi:hypothetical protein
VSGTANRRSSDAILAIARRAVLVILLLAMGGILAELLLIEHFEDVWQWIPLVLLGVGIAITAWNARAGSRVSTHMLRAIMAMFVIAGFVGLFLHYDGNVEFELEQNPNAGRWELFRDAMMGATPALAPGVMIQIGLLGFLYAFLTERNSGTSDGRWKSGIRDDQR